MWPWYSLTECPVSSAVHFLDQIRVSLWFSLVLNPQLKSAAFLMEQPSGESSVCMACASTVKKHLFVHSLCVCLKHSRIFCLNILHTEVIWGTTEDPRLICREISSFLLHTYLRMELKMLVLCVFLCAFVVHSVRTCMGSQFSFSCFATLLEHWTKNSMVLLYLDAGHYCKL